LDVKSFLLLNADETEATRLREKWALEAELKEAPKKEQVKVNTVTTNRWLSNKIDAKVRELRKEAEERADAGRRAEERRIGELNTGLHQALGEEFLRNVEVEITNGTAKFEVAGTEYFLQKDGDKFVMNGSFLSTPISSAIVNYFAQKQVSA
jgi:hypothetical protein